MIRADLHMHSTYSDGVLTPDLLVDEARQAGVVMLAITDHDTFDGSDKLLGRDLPVTVIPGVELSLRDLPGLHLLCYGVTEAAALRSTVCRLGELRLDRARRMLEQLAALGMPLDWKTLERKYHGTVGRPHVARAMVHAGYVRCMQEAFDRYLGHGKPAYVPSERLSMAEALPLVTGSGFIPVLAHPYELKQEDHLLYTLLEKWQGMGLRGIEVYHPSAGSHGYAALDRMARRLGLLVTGGSDFHQENDKHGRIGCISDAWVSAEDDVQALICAMNAKR